MINLVSHYTWIWTHCILLWYLGRLQHRLYVGVFPAPHARTGGVLIFALRRVKHTNTIFYVVRQIRLHPRERFILLDIEIHGRRLHLLQWQQGCCHCSSLFSLYSHVLSLSLLFSLTLLSNNCLFYRHFMVRQDPQNEALIMLHYLPSGSGVFATIMAIS